MATVTTQDEFRAALTGLEAEIILANDITLTSYASVTYTVTIKGETPGISLFWGNPRASSPNMLVVSGAGVLTLESIILDAEGRDGTLVQINGGTVIMEDGAIIRNIQSTTSQAGVNIGTLTSFLGGTLIMNGGLITGIDGSNAIFCSGGSVIMNNNASVSENAATGIVLTKPINGGERGSLTMTGTSRVFGNRSKQPAGGVSVLEADVFMGENEGDAPEIRDNRSVSGGTNYAGGIVLTDNSTLTMRYGSKICENYSDYAGAGILAQDTVITMSGEASVTDNVCEGAFGGGGVRIHQGTRLMLEDNAHISNNTSTTNGGGVFMQHGSYLEMKGNSSIFENTALNGGGIFVTSAGTSDVEASIGAENSNPRIYGNTASENGGGIYIGQLGNISLSGHSCIHDNEAVNGKGIYKEGELNVSQSVQVLDGLFFDRLIAPYAASNQSNQPSDIKIAAQPSEDNSHIVYTALPINFTEAHRTVSVLADPAYTDNVPVISNQLTGSSIITLETSGHVSTDNVPLVIAEKGADCELFSETERAPWKIPADFGQGYTVILNPELDQVLIVYEVYGIKYCHLYDADNPNPDSYSIDDEFPIALQKPGKWEGYEFAGWYNCAGQLMTEIPEGATGNMQLIALWNEKKVFRIKYCHLYGAYNPNPHFYGSESQYPIILKKPGERNGYVFTGWYDCTGQLVTQIPAGTTGDLLLIALWQETRRLYLRFDGNAPCVSNVPEQISVNPYENVIIPPDKPKRKRYRFIGWNTCPRGTGRHYDPGDVIKISNASVTLYAQWRPICCDEEEDCIEETYKKRRWR